MEKASFKTTNSWQDMNWAKVQRKVFKLQKRIFQAVKSGQKAKARKLQKLLLKSHYAKLLAIRKVTQDNQGKKTAGIDGQKIIYPQQRLNLIKELSPKGYKAKALRRVWIPKPGRDEKRPLGIPTILDRAMQALVKSALEPYWEAQFEGTSYGFRPGRSAHDPIGYIHNCTNQGTKYVLDADIAKCFDKINHDYLLSKLECPSNLRKIIKQWLKAGVMDNGVFESTDMGTPQGGVISPLLANIALDGMIRDIRKEFPKTKWVNKERNHNYKPFIIRYADDFVVLHKDLDVIFQCQKMIASWLRKLGLQLKPEKTHICHTLYEINIDGKTYPPGFNFLGFNIRSYHTGKHNSSRTPGKKSKALGFKTLIKPSKESIKSHHETIKEVIQAHKKAPQEALIKSLIPVIRGWCNYFRAVTSQEIFGKEDHNLWQLLRAWTVSRTRKASRKKLSIYFSQGKHGKWTFQNKNGYVLTLHKDIKMLRHTLIKPEASPYDGNWTYWSKRQGTYPETPTRVAKLIKKQKGKCNHCQQSFMPDDVVEVDHIIPKSKGGKDEYTNLQLLHRHCHDNKTRYDGSLNRDYLPPDRKSSNQKRYTEAVISTQEKV
ncbi:MAG: group II intron reverse transcriptase/maturase [Microcoleaceae cyanobacterium]